MAPLKPRYAIIITWRGDMYRYHTPATGRNLWEKSTAQRLVRDNTHAPHQVAQLVAESDLGKWIGARHG